ncbi:MAG: hypothetical protein LQ350_006336 [Teloschistes chrysophthalmus]|nr:MAG: hypothetical protein LQ350_006336 [Niorma chrysophthalma]
MSNTAAVLPTAKSPLQIQSRPIPNPSSTQLLVKNAAIATNPVDYKIQDAGIFVEKYPIVLGSDVSGVVEAVGPSVTRFKKGDRVAGFAASVPLNDCDRGGFQEYTILNENVTAKLPELITSEEGAILPMAVATAGVGIFINLGIPRPAVRQNSNGSVEKKQSGGFLVWGASSSVGSTAVQIAHSLGFTVYAVCSPKHHDNTREYGASHVFDYNDANVVTNILNAAKQAGQSIKYALDAISENGSCEQVVSLLEQQGGGKAVLTLGFPEDKQKPENVETSVMFAYRVNTDLKEFGGWLFNEWLETGLADKTFVPSPGIQKIEGGIQAVPKALDLHKKGVNGKKLVLPLA